MDTANDPRLRVAEQALGTLRRIFELGHLQARFPRKRCAGACEKALGALRSLRYAYVGPDDLVAMPQFETVVGTADVVRDHLGGEGWVETIQKDALAVARVRWGLELLEGLGARLRLEGEGLERGVDARAGRVVSTRAHPGGDELQVCAVAAGRSLQVVTNDGSVEADDRVGVALLQPVSIRDVVSEGMLLGVPDGGVLRPVEAGADGRPDVPDDAWKGTRGLIAELLD